MTDVLGFNLNDGFNFEFVFLGLIIWVCVLVLFVFWNLSLCLVMVCAFMFLCWFLNLWSYSCSKWIRSKLMYFIVFQFCFFFFYLVKIDKLLKKINKCWCAIFYNILILPAATSIIFVGWLMEKMEIICDNWFRD